MDRDKSFLLVIADYRNSEIRQLKLLPHALVHWCRQNVAIVRWEKMVSCTRNMDGHCCIQYLQALKQLFAMDVVTIAILIRCSFRHWFNLRWKPKSSRDTVVESYGMICFSTSAEYTEAWVEVMGCPSNVNFHIWPYFSDGYQNSHDDCNSHHSNGVRQTCT